MAITQNYFTKRLNEIGAVPVGTKSSTNAMGAQAKSPEQNVKNNTNKLAPNQAKTTTPVKTTSALTSPTKTTFSDTQNTGLLAALSRQKSGTATPEDTKNLEYAKSKGWSGGTAPVANTATVAKPLDISSKGVLTSLAQTSTQGSNTAQQAQTGLLSTSQVNPATSGQAYTDYQTAIDELEALKNEMAEKTAGISSSPIPLEFQQGRQQVLNNLYSSKLEAAQQKVNQAQAAINQQLTGTQTQQAGFTQAGNLGQAGQGLIQSGLGTVAGFTQPRELQYGVQYINPQTGEAVGGSNADMNSTINYWAQQIAQNKASINDVPTTISGNVALKTQLQQAIQSQTGGTYNPSVQTSGQETAASLNAQANQLQASLNGAEANFTLLTNTAIQGGVNNYDVPILNTLQQNIAKGLTSNSAVVNFQSTLSAVRSQYAAILGGGTVTVDSQNRAQQAIPDNISLSALKNLEGQMRIEAQNRIAGFTSQINSLTGGGANSGTNNSSVSDVRFDF